MSNTRRPSYEEMEFDQKALCVKYKTQFQPSPPNSKLGVALETLNQSPINGLRHSPVGDTNGWYIWGGETLSASPDFFKPLHTEHLIVRLPDILKFLGLPPGYRFLVDRDTVDIWLDEDLLR